MWLDYMGLSLTNIHAKTQDVFKPPHRYATIYARVHFYQHLPTFRIDICFLC
jgi:hypothetical protein